MKDFKVYCPYCKNCIKHKLVRENGVDSSGLIYECSSCKKLFTIPDTCGSLCVPIPFKGKIEGRK